MSHLGLSIFLTFVLLSGCKTKYVSGSGPDPHLAIQELKGGTLIVFLHSFRNELQALSELSEAETLKQSQKDAINIKYNETIERRDKYMLAIMTSFEQDYSFSDVLYSLDYELQEIKDGGNVIQQVMGDLSTQKMKVPENAFFLKYVQKSKADSSVDYDWSFHTSDLEYLSKPFPSYYNFNPSFIPRFWRGVMAMFKKSNPLEYHINIGKDLDTQLNKFYSGL